MVKWKSQKYNQFDSTVQFELICQTPKHKAYYTSQFLKAKTARFPVLKLNCNPLTCFESRGEHKRVQFVQ